LPLFVTPFDIIMQRFFCVLLLFVTAAWAQITAPTASTVWVNGEEGQITWTGLSQYTEFTIVLTRNGTVYHHTIFSYTANTDSYAWIVDIPPGDGWPASTSTQQVYVLDFYVNGGWNNGGTLVTQSQNFAIVYSGDSSSGDQTDTGGQTDSVTSTGTGGGGFGTSTETELVVQVTTFTTIVTLVYPTTSGGQEVTVTETQGSVVTSTVTNLEDVSTSSSGGFVTNTQTGATTIIGNTANSAAATDTGSALISGASGSYGTQFTLMAVMMLVVGFVFFGL
jgi:hypothetical protein